MIFPREKRFKNPMPFNFTKKSFLKLLIEQPWKNVKKHFDNSQVYVPKLLHNLNIDPHAWKQFCIDHYKLGDHVWESPKPYYSKNTVDLINANLSFGRHKLNTYEINFGKNHKASSILKTILGNDNLKKMNLNEDFLLIRLLVKLPGQGVAWHVDEANTFLKKFPDLQVDKNYNTQNGKIVRYWFPVTDWEDGHMFQISKTILWQYKKGDVFQIPFGIGHASANAGFTPYYSVALTGIVKD